ncbi:MAG TPA: PASTA domain-containing protein [Terriglobales bacterium]|jgi:eukaryotic-like serine/threonine-protein kinase|nr:PASTA domain-containing protein [Terriglobales bacterium]
MKQVVRLVLMGLVLVTVALISALTAMRIAIHGSEVEIPKLVGMAPQDAERASAALGLQLVIERQYYSPEIAEGRIMSQIPPSGVKVRRGWQVRVAQSLGPQRVSIPDVVGQSERAAELTIRRRGLEVESLAQVDFPEVPSDRVLAQNPQANASGVAAPKMNLLVSTLSEAQSFIMPNFVGQPLGNITSSLQDAGMRLGDVSVALPAANPNSPVLPTPIATSPQATPASIIVSQNPAPGQKVRAGTVVTFEVQ